MKIKKIILLIIFIQITAVLFLFSIPNALAINDTRPKITMPDIQIDIGGLKGNFSKSICTGEGANRSCSTLWIAEYITAIYKYALGIVGILATVVMMIGGIIWLTAGGSSSRITEAKAWITASLTGLIIALASYTILYQVNPELVKLKAIKIGMVSEIEPGAEISEIATNMDCFSTTYGKDANEVSKNLVSASFLGKNFQVNSSVAQALKKAEAKISSSYTINGGAGFNWRQNVNNPGKLSMHSFGIAIDINPSTNPNYKPKTGPCKTDIPADIINALKDQGFKWGGDFSSVCDSMHFEWTGAGTPCM